MKRKTPGQIAREAYYNNDDLNATPAWESAAAAVLAEPLATLTQLLAATTARDIQDLYDARAGARELLEMMLLPQPPVDPYESLKKAHTAGKVIQFETSRGLWVQENHPTWNHSPDRYRIKPWTLTRHLPGFRPLADGEEWNPEDPDSPWLESDLPNGYRPALKGEAGSFEGWYAGSKTWGQTAAPKKAVPPGLKYRTTRPLPPTKEELELQAFETWWNDYKLGCVARTPNRDTAYAAWKAARTANTNHEKAK